MFRRVGVAGASIVSVGLGVLLLGLWRFNRLVRRDVEALFLLISSSENYPSTHSGE